MAGNKMNTKTKGKEDKSKTNRSLVQANEENEDLDFSLLRKPILTSVTGFAQARKIFDWATEELKGLLSNECDLLYECKVCRNIFRSLANFISHKRIYCKEKFNSSHHGNFFKAGSAVDELIKINELEESYFKSMSEKHGSEDISINDVDARIPLTKDLTAIVEQIVKNHGVCDKKGDDEQGVILQKIPNSSVAVFQTVDNTEGKQDRMRAQVNELNAILSKDKAVLHSDGSFEVQSSEVDNVIQISDDEEENEYRDDLKCKICDQIFSTLKTLKFHMKYKHLESRLVYPCPDCLEIFSTSWSVYRHLFKVHRKTAAQIRRLRESIQSKAFKMNNPPAFYEKRKNMRPVTQKISEEERLDQENQAWLDNVEGDGGVARCFGCGRSFERRAALAAHAHTCQPRRRLAGRRTETKKIEIQIRKDYNKGPQALALPIKINSEQTENKTSNDEEVSPDPKSAVETEEKEIQKERDEIQEYVTSNAMDEDEMSSDTVESPEKTAEIGPETPQKSAPSMNKLPFAHQAEKSNLTAFRQRIQPHIEVDTLLCKKCDVQHNTVQELYDHMAQHYNWMRYACKLCNFKTYYFSKLPEHVKVVHKLKGNSDFYFSTVKAIDGTEALELSGPLDDMPPAKDISPESRRQSRCSSDSSRLSDDSSSSSTRAEIGSRKRKMFTSKLSSKRRKPSLVNGEDDVQKLDMSLDRDSNSNSVTMEDSSSMSKTFEENSSDFDDMEEKVSRRQRDVSSSVASRRPVRKKTKRKNEDFEYDLSNLLKMEAQGYRDSQVPTTNPKTTQKTKKAPNQENINYYEIINRDCCGALTTLSKKAVENSAAHYKNTGFTNDIGRQRDPRSSNIFVRPMLPKFFAKTDKNSPKKDIVEDAKDSVSPQKETTPAKGFSENTIIEETINVESLKETLNKKESLLKKDNTNKSDNLDQNESSKKIELSNKDSNPSNSNAFLKTIPSVVPIKFCRNSIELIKNPIINKNITDFKKAGMKTKILVVKPINRNKAGSSLPNTPLKFQTIKLKDPSKKSSSNEEKPSDQVVLVKVPKVENISRNAKDSNSISKEKVEPVIDKSIINNNVTDNEEIENNSAVESMAAETTAAETIAAGTIAANGDVEELGTETNSIAENKKDITDIVDSKLVSDEKELVEDKEVIENGTDST